MVSVVKGIATPVSTFTPSMSASPYRFMRSCRSKSSSIYGGVLGNQFTARVYVVLFRLRFQLVYNSKRKLKWAACNRSGRIFVEHPHRMAWHTFCPLCCQPVRVICMGNTCISDLLESRFMTIQGGKTSNTIQEIQSKIRTTS